MKLDIYDIGQEVWFLSGGKPTNGEVFGFNVFGCKTEDMRINYYVIDSDGNFHALDSHSDLVFSSKEELLNYLNHENKAVQY